MTRLLIIGSRGFVGSGLAETARGRKIDLLSDTGIDITDSKNIQLAFAKLRPQAVILLAAVADIDRCQREQALAERINVDGALHVAQACADSGARLVFTSTGAVFDGLKHGYVEDDLPSPVSFYGETKVRAEAGIQVILPSAAIVRISLVLGFSRRPGTNSMLDKFWSLLVSGTPAAAPLEEFRNPIDTGTLDEFLLHLAARPEAAGIFNLGSADSISRYELMRRLAGAWNFPEKLVQPSMDSHPGRAPRGRDHFLISEKISKACAIPIPNCEQVIERCLHAAT